MSQLPFVTRTLLASYPPSWVERYGAEQRALIEDTSARGTTFDLARGAVRAWVRPRFGARTAAWQRQRLLASISTLWTMWVLAFFGGAAWSRAVNDPPIQGIGTHWGQNIWNTASVAFNVGVVTIAMIVSVVFGVVGVRALQQRQWQVLRPLVPFGALLVFEFFAFFILGALRYSHFVVGHNHYLPAQSLPLWYQLALLLWVLLLIPLMVLGARTPVLSLRGSDISQRTLRTAYWLGAVPSLCLAVLSVVTTLFFVLQLNAGREAFRSLQQTRAVYDFIGNGVQLAATVGLLGVGAIAVVSYVRGLGAATTHATTE